MFTREGRETPPSCSGCSISNIEDSGYYTSFTPSYSENSACIVDSYDPVSCLREKNNVGSPLVVASTPRKGPKGVKNVSFNLQSPGRRSSSSSKKENTPQKERKARKRQWRESEEGCDLFTPTNIIATGLQNLKVVDNTSNNDVFLNSNNDSASDCLSFSIGDISKTYPLTPKKSHQAKIKRFSSSKETQPFSLPRIVLSPIKHSNINIIKSTRRPVEKLDFNSEQRICRIILLESKADILTQLHNAGIVIALKEIFEHLSGEDLYKFGQVCKSWKDIRDTDRKATQKVKSYLDNIYKIKENLNNIKKTSVPQCGEGDKHLRDIQNTVNARKTSLPSECYPHSPRSRKYLNYFKCASLDSRLQIPCLRCKNPAKVNREETGEEWAECTSKICGFVCCRYCKCARHVNHPCSGYDHEAASPSKRLRRNPTVIGSKKNRSNLRRLYL